jgi:type II secretory pathway component PulF
LIRSRLWIGLVYPLLLLAAGLAIGLFILMWPIPAFREIFNDFGVNLPGITIMAIRVSDFVVAASAYWPLILTVILLLAAAIYSIRYLPGRAERVRLFQYLPLIGSASRYAALSEFCSLLAILVQSRVPLPAALQMTAEAVRDPNLAAGSRELAEQVAHGLPAESAARALSHFPGSVATLFRWQGQPHALARALRSSGELFATQARLQSGVVGLLLQPVLLFFIVAFVGTIVIALFMPLIKLLNELS